MQRICLTIGFVMTLLAGPVRGEPIRFSRDVLPILSDRCFHCHGPDESHREADLRLDLQENATEDRGGYAVISPGNPVASELLTRITTDDTDLLMPPADSHRKPLSPREVAILKQWIAEGAAWGKHWAFEKPVQPDIPQSAKSAVDVLVEKRLQSEGLNFSPPASRNTLIRRLSFDLTGLPPTPEDVEAFCADKSSDAVEKLVDRLLASPHYGERMAMWWLDAARYSDTDGFQQDANRTNWPWRDWVVQAFNTNMPFDQFTIEQFAGDLLPEATPEQILATCFHRNHMTNGEGGRDPEESRIDYVIDRVNTTGTVWLGLTLGCAQCHSHKFDPISQQDYYSLFAFFNSIDEDGKAGSKAKPYLKYQSPLADRAVQEAEELLQIREQRYQQVRQQAEQEFEAWLNQQKQQLKQGFVPWQILSARELQAVGGTVLTQEADGAIQSSGPTPFHDDYRVIARPQLTRITGLKLEVLPHATHTAGKLSRGFSGEFVLTDVKLQVRQAGESQIRDIDLRGAVADVEVDVKARMYGKIKDTLDDDPRNGWTTESFPATEPHTAVFALAEPLSLAADEELMFVMFHRSTEGNANIGRFRLSVTDQPGAAVDSLEPMPFELLAETLKATSGDEDSVPLEPALQKKLLEQFLVDHEVYQQASLERDLAASQLASIKKGAGDLNVMVLAEREQPRETHILMRGVWDQKGEIVSRSVPSAVLDWPAEKTQNRLELARWLVSSDNPLTARVVVNQLWQNCFGAGLVRTPEDFGLQGEFPTHPELLDWLALELIQSGWDIKHVLKQIVCSQTYQQSSAVSSELLERDPENRLLARGPRYRLPSWMIRDAALKVSGLLNPALGGPPVMPYQPEGVWEEMFMGRFQYEPSQGPAQHRRTLYAFWRRSAAPTFLFDSAQRRVCEVTSRRTNTPLQALTLLNDLSLLEAARQLAGQVHEQTEDTDQRVRRIVQAILSREPTSQELTVLKREWNRAKTYYEQDTAHAVGLLDFGQPELKPDAPSADLAASMIVCSLVFNLDEAITHE